MKFNNRWNKINLYDCANWQNGLAFNNVNFSDKGIPIIKIAELKNGLSQQTGYTKDIFEKKFYIKKDDLIFSWSGNPKTSIDAFLFKLEEGYLNQHSFKVIPKTNLINKYFLYYVLKYLKPEFISIASDKQTTGLGHVTISDLKRINIKIPTLDEQSKILEILKKIDDKIELNNQINDNLLDKVA